MRKSSSLIVIFIFSLTILYSQSAMDYYQAGEEQYNSAHYFEAIQSFREALALNPHYLEALLQLARSYFMIEEYQEAQLYISQAQQYGLNNIELLNMEGRILIGQGALQDAEQLFRRVIIGEPNNLEANLGLAEVLLLMGNHHEGALAYRRSLILSPESKRALLSMLLLFDSQGEFEKAQIYLDLALKYHSRDPQVFLQAAHHYLRSGDLERALYYGENAVQMDSALPGPDYLLARIYFKQRAFESASSALQRELRRNPEDTQALFLMAQCQYEMGEYNNAMVLFQRLIKEQPLDEIARIHWEELLRERGEEFSRQINEGAAYHHQLGNQMEESFEFSRAQDAYRRSRWIDPYYYPSWLDSSLLLLKQGYEEQALNSLRALRDSGYDDLDFLEMLRIREHSREDSLADQWGIDQFQLSPNSYDISIFYRSNPSMFHFSSEEILAEYFSFKLIKYNTLDITFHIQEIDSYSLAFQQARRENSQYFMVLNFSEGQRSFFINADLYLTRTGRLINSFSVLRFGADRVSNGASELAESISRFVIPRGFLLDIDNRQGVINLGRIHGVQEEQVFQVLKPDSVVLTAEDPWVEYEPEDLMGYLHIESVLEGISMGRWENNGPFSMVAPGDHAYLLSTDSMDEELGAEMIPWTVDEELKQQLLMLQ